MTDPFPRLLILGHRGAPREALENTLRSFELALDHGADGVELDVHGARDGTPVVIHDATLDRTFGIRGRVDAHDWPALQRLTGARLPSLQQAAAWAAASGAWLNVEMKAAGVEEETVDILDEHGLMDRTFLSSFDAAIVTRLGEIAPDARRFLLTDEWNDEVHDRLRASGAGGVCLRDDAATHLNLDVIRHEGLPVVIWTVDRAERVTSLAAAGVAAIISNDPATAVDAIRGMRGRP